QVQEVEPNPCPFVEFEPDAQIGERGGSGGYAAVLDQRPPAKMAEAQRAEPGSEILYGRIRRCDHIWSIRDVIAWMAGLGVIGAGVEISETRPAGGEMAIEPEPGE